MKLSMPKPLYGWQAFSGEVGVVVFGVLLALGAQQIVETLNERRVAAETRKTLTGEIEESLAVLELRRAAQPCIDRRLQELRGLVNQWGGTGSFETPRWVSQATWFAFDTARFEAAQSAGRLALLSSEEQYRFGLVVGSLRTFRDIQRRETDAWSTLRMLQSGPEVLSDSDRTAVRVALQEASTLNHFAQISVGQTLPQAAEFGWRPDMKRVQERMKLAWKDGRFRPSVCLSIDTPPDQAHREANLIYPLPE
jgi:hypothetical protein